MSGHSKWAKVKHFKGAIDAKRGRIFSKLSREIIVAAKSGGGEPKLNARLRQAIDAAKAQNMPNDTIERAIKKGSGELGGETIIEVTYEGYAPGGAALLIECVTDNKNRTSADIRSIFTRNHGSLGTPGSVAHLFARKGEIRVPFSGVSEEALLDAALDAGADDVTLEGEEHVVVTAPDQLFAVGDALKAKGITAITQQLVQVPLMTITVTEAATAAQVVRLYEALDELDDVQNVHANFAIPDEVMEQLHAH
ncbi:MAG: YebC/PmpR family DNA-binding transcriptional regulator [Verrucomicrobiales bacterium]